MPSLAADCRTAAGAGPRKAAWRALQRMAAPRWTVLAFVLIATGAIWIAEGDGPPTAAMVPPLSLLTLNLTAALVTHPRLRTDLPLLVFHLALLMLIGLVLVARLTYLDGTVAITRGAAFTGELAQVERGPWHGDGVQALRFGNEGFVDDFPADGNEYRTFNRISWWDDGGRMHVTEIGDDRPLVLNGYRIYATRRGLAPRLLWQRNSGEVEFASIQLGSIEPDGWYGGNTWQLPDGPEIWLGMEHRIEYPTRGTRRIDLGAAAVNAPVLARIGDETHALPPSASLSLHGGTLSYVRLDTWMGYRVVYDPTVPWMIGTVVTGIISLIVFYARRIFRPGGQESFA